MFSQYSEFQFFKFALDFKKNLHVQVVLNLNSRPAMGFKGKSPTENATINFVCFCVYQQTQPSGFGSCS